MRTATNAAIPSQNSLRRKFHSQRNSPNSTILNAANTTSPPRAAMREVRQQRTGEQQDAHDGQRRDQAVGRGAGRRDLGQRGARAAAGHGEARGQPGADVGHAQGAKLGVCVDLLARRGERPSRQHVVGERHDRDAGGWPEEGEERVRDRSGCSAPGRPSGTGPTTWTPNCSQVEPRRGQCRAQDGDQRPGHARPPARPDEQHDDDRQPDRGGGAVRVARAGRRPTRSGSAACRRRR